jgi:hypothetical protein
VAKLLLAALLAAANVEAPAAVQERARAVVAEVLAGVEGAEAVQVKVFRTRAAMEAAVRAVDRKAPADFVAWYHYGTRTMFAYMAPRPDDALFEGRLPGLLLGALVHEAQHARGALTDPRYRRRPDWETEGEADRDTVRFLRASSRPGAGAWAFLYASRWQRLRAMGIDAARRDVAPGRLPPPQRAAWYTLAFHDALGEDLPELDWVLMDGTAAPGGDGYRIVSEPRRPAHIVRWRGAGPLSFDVVTLPVGKGQVDVHHGPHKVSFIRRGGVRAMWRRPGDDRWARGPLHPAPPLRPGRRYRIALDDGYVRLDGGIVLRVVQAEGRVGIGVWDGAADVTPR